MTERPDATDYRNKGERDAAYWRELWERYIASEEGEPGVAIYEEAVRELARINAEALR
jgi:hypothetical protein